MRTAKGERERAETEACDTLSKSLEADLTEISALMSSTPTEALSNGHQFDCQPREDLLLLRRRCLLAVRQAVAWKAS